eukprot:4391434-Pleurochrysis_carterae.AAC.1
MWTTARNVARAQRLRGACVRVRRSVRAFVRARERACMRKRVRDRMAVCFPAHIDYCSTRKYGRSARDRTSRMISTDLSTRISTSPARATRPCRRMCARPLTTGPAKASTLRFHFTHHEEYVAPCPGLDSQEAESKLQLSTSLLCSHLSYQPSPPPFLNHLQSACARTQTARGRGGIQARPIGSGGARPTQSAASLLSAATGRADAGT